MGEVISGCIIQASCHSSLFFFLFYALPTKEGLEFYRGPEKAPEQQN